MSKRSTFWTCWAIAHLGYRVDRPILQRPAIGIFSNPHAKLVLMRILVVEDNAMASMVVVRHLNKIGYIDEGCA